MQKKSTEKLNNQNNGCTTEIQLQPALYYDTTDLK